MRSPCPLITPFRLATSLAATLLLGCAGEPARPAVSDVPAVDAADVPAPRDVFNQDVTDVSTDVPARGLRVLFIGNSYTYVNDLPGAVARIAAEGAGDEGRPTIAVDSAVEGGATLQLHWERMRQDRVRMGPWDAVVLQGQSVEPILSFQSFDSYARRFAAVIRGEGARVVYYATWARRPGDAVYAQAWSGGSFAAMTARLDNAYRLAAMNTAGELAAVGARWADARADHPAIDLYDPDGSHPSVAGTFLAACVMYRALTGFAPSARVTAPPGVAPDDAARLRAISARE